MSEAVYVSRIEELLKLKSDMTKETISVNDLADYVGVSRQTIYLWMSEKGVNSLPTAERQRKLEKFFSVTWDKIWTLKRADDEYPQLVVVSVGV